MRSLPSLPALYLELTDALQSENTSLRQIEEIIEKDIGMATKILQLANSAFIAAHGRVSSLHEALSLIGAETVRSLTLSIHVFSQSSREPATAAHYSALWVHSVAVAALAQRIAMLETKKKAISDEAFTTGLIHDVGKIVLLSELPNEYRKVIQEAEGRPQSFHEMEMQHLGCTHGQVGAYLMSIWGLPSTIVQAVEYHDRPSEIGGQEFTPLTAVHCADVIVSSSDTAHVNRDVEFDDEYGQALGIADKITGWSEDYAERKLAAEERMSP
jgi:HD-like signal output (HDOD) protein